MNKKRFKNLIREQVREQVEVESAVRGWEHQDAADYASKLSVEFGEPEVMSEDGYAEWRNIAGFKRVSVRDERILHTFPKKHYDFVYSTREIKVDPTYYSDFANVTGSIIIDGLKKEVTARCGDIVANAVTLGFVEDVVEGRTEPTKDEYGRRIENLVVPDWFNDPMNEM